MQQQPTRHCPLASAGWWLAQATNITAWVFKQLADKVATAAVTAGSGQGLVVHKLHQAPGAGDGKQRLHTGHCHLFGIQLPGLHQGFNVVQRCGFAHVLMDVVKQAGVDVGLPA